MLTRIKYYCIFVALQAKVAQLVEHNLAKVGVASSNLVFRSKQKLPNIGSFCYFREWLLINPNGIIFTS